MSQIQRTLADLLSRFPDNSGQLITPERLRDFVVSAGGSYGSAYVTGNVTETVVLNGIYSSIDLTGASTASGVGNGVELDPSAPAGVLRLIYTTNVASMMAVAISGTIDSPSNQNRVYELALVVDGEVAGVGSMFVTTNSSGEVGSFNGTLFGGPVDAGTTLEVQIRGVGTADNVVVSNLNMVVRTSFDPFPVSAGNTNPQASGF